MCEFNTTSKGQISYKLTSSIAILWQITRIHLRTTLSPSGNELNVKGTEK